jgi:catechol 2,3-dioxygenase-like lactoylglutathione lyase family enzyme
MLSNINIKAFVPTTKPEQAKQFYKDILGLKLLSEDSYALEFEAGESLLRVVTVQELTPHSFTILGWNIPDISSTIKSLIDKGIVFEQYGFMKQDGLGIWISPGGSQVAWFKDPDGNVLSLTQV